MCALKYIIHPDPEHQPKFRVKWGHLVAFGLNPPGGITLKAVLTQGGVVKHTGKPISHPNFWIFYFKNIAQHTEQTYTFELRNAADESIIESSKPVIVKPPSFGIGIEYPESNSTLTARQFIAYGPTDQPGTVTAQIKDGTTYNGASVQQPSPPGEPTWMWSFGPVNPDTYTLTATQPGGVSATNSGIQVV
jgi:hypothetical protein